MAPTFSGSACPEKQLLAYCARTRIQPEVSREIQKLLADPLDWDYLLDEAEENSVTPLLERQLRALAPDSIPAAANERLKQASRANTVRCLFLTTELFKVLDLFRSHGIQGIPYKGPVLAVQAYGDIALREFEDLDVILRQRDLPKAHEAMLGLGYRPKFDWILSPGASASLVPGEYNYRDEGRRVMVELHTERTLRHFPVVPDLDDFAQRLVAVSLSGHEILTFSVEDLLPILCIHGAKDFWERLSWIADISELVQAYPEIDWNKVMSRAAGLNARRILSLGLLLAATVLDAPLPPEILRRIQGDRVAAEVASEVAQRLLSRGTCMLDAAGIFRFRRRMLPGVFEGWRYAVRLAVVPAEEDWLMMRLPRPLTPLYIALRPLRLLRKYGWSGRRAE
jgi:Uncharacterised nucleotidyltransferase